MQVSGLLRKMMSGIHFEQGNIVLASIPFTDLTEVKKRPVLVISNETYNSTSDDIIVLAITSNLSERNHTIRIDNDSLIWGALPKASRIKADHIIKISKQIIKKELSKVKSSVLLNAISEFKSVIDK